MCGHTPHGLDQKSPYLLAQRFVWRRNGRRIQRIKLTHANTPFSNNIFMVSPSMADLTLSAKCPPI
jgi:hypothetical protein